NVCDTADVTANLDVLGIGLRGPVFPAENPMIGKLLADERAHALFGGAVGCRHGIEPADFLVLDRESGTKKGKDGFARRGRKFVDETAEVDGRHAACPVWRLTIEELVSRHSSGRTGLSSRFSAAMRNLNLVRFRIRSFKSAYLGRQACKISMGKPPANLDSCASRCTLLQCGSESCRCPPWAFPP